MLHARLEELLCLLIDRYVPASYLTLLGRVAPLLNSMRGVLGKGLPLPSLPANLPGTPAQLKGVIVHELRQRPLAELAQLIQMAHLTTGAWLAELEASLIVPEVSTPSDEETPADERSPRDASPVA